MQQTITVIATVYLAWGIILLGSLAGLIAFALVSDYIAQGYLRYFRFWAVFMEYVRYRKEFHEWREKNK